VADSNGRQTAALQAASPTVGKPSASQHQDNSDEQQKPEQWAYSDSARYGGDDQHDEQLY
jgi:hypothetical protein